MCRHCVVGVPEPGVSRLRPVAGPVNGAKRRRTIEPARAFRPHRIQIRRVVALIAEPPSGLSHPGRPGPPSLRGTGGTERFHNAAQESAEGIVGGYTH